MDTLVKVTTQREYDIVVALLVKSGKKPFRDNHFSEYRSDTYIRYSDDSPILSFGWTKGTSFAFHAPISDVLTYCGFLTQQISNTTEETSWKK